MIVGLGACVYDDQIALESLVPREPGYAIMPV